jgi:hypothetical protein
LLFLKCGRRKLVGLIYCVSSGLHNLFPQLLSSSHPKSAIQNPKSSVRFVLRARHYALLPLLVALCAMPVTAAFAASVTIAWEPNDEPDLEGYVVYHNPDSPGPPYQYSDTLPEDELADPLNPRLKLTGLQNNTEYYIALTAYNMEGLESGFSNEVCVEVVSNSIQLCSEAIEPAAAISSNSGALSDGHRGACFISSIAGESSAQQKPDTLGSSKRLIWLSILLPSVLIVFLCARRLARRAQSLEL